MPTISHLKSALQKRLWFLAWLSLACLLVGQLGTYYWLFELFAHFTPYYAIFLALGCCTAHKKWRLFFAMIAIAAFYWCITPWPVAHQQNTSQTKPVRLLSYNVLFSN